jgi:exodeoxyribonuclease-3
VNQAGRARWQEVALGLSGGGLVAVMWTWARGTQILTDKTRRDSVPLTDLIEIETGPLDARQTIALNLTLVPDACDIEAGDALDLDGVGLYRYPNEINIDAAKGVRIDNVYIPAGGEVPDSEVNSKFGQKLSFLKRMAEWSRNVTQPTILTGDFNVAPLEQDVWSHKQLLNVVSHTRVELEHLAEIQAAADWVDIARHFVDPSKKLYTWWSYRAQDWETSDRGRRLDHMWVTPDLKENAKAHIVHKHVRGWGKPSDHAPIVTEFAF